MNASQMLHQMCHDELSIADVNAIRRNRGFSKRETASRALLENFLLSESGVRETLASLTEREIALLHFLNFIGEEVAIPVFVRVYSDVDRPHNGTYTQRYKPVFKKARRSLIRKGVLLAAEDHSLPDADTKNERRRFRFPRQFRRFLPPLVHAQTFEGSGEFRPYILRQKLMEVLPDGSSTITAPESVDKQYRLRLERGELRLGNGPFRLRRLLEWQRACWAASIPAPQRYTVAEARRRKSYVWPSERGPVVSPVEAATYAFSQLGKNEWIHPRQLSLPLKVFCDEKMSGKAICETGWQWGCLARQELDGSTHYRSAERESTVDVEPGHHLHVHADQDLVVSLEAIPLQMLESLARISDLAVADAPGPCLAASPSLIKMGRALESIQGQPLISWLRENAPSFRRALEVVEQRWGKQILHENLFVAKVNDVGLKVQLEREFSDPRKVLFLPNDHIAFPRRMLSKVRKVVTGAGHVIKWVENDG